MTTKDIAVAAVGDADQPVERSLVQRGGGRPTKDEALVRHQRILEIAAHLFETRGYGGTSMDAVAEEAGVGKPTVYAKFGDKQNLFQAVFRARVEKLLGPLTHLLKASADQEPGSLADGLHAIGQVLLRHLLSEDAISLHRIVIGEAMAFPEIALMTHQEGWLRAVALVADVLRLRAPKSRSNTDDAAEAADMFLSLVMGRQQRAMMLGVVQINEDAIERRVSRAVQIFLNGWAS